MHVIAARSIREFADAYVDARKALMEWLITVEHARWATIDDVRAVYPHADAVKVKSGNDVIVFNIKGNRYRLIAAVHFNRQKVYTLRLLTHAEYDKDKWKQQL